MANIHFLGSDLCQYFQGNSACGNPTFVFRTSNFTYWPVSSWAAHATAWVTPKVYLHVGAYEVNPIQAQDGQHGLNWSTNDTTGVVVPMPWATRTRAATAAWPPCTNWAAGRTTPTTPTAARPQRQPGRTERLGV